MFRRGFTLIEVIISVAVLCIIFVPALSLFSASRLSLKYSRDMAQELSAARSAMEYYNNKDYHSLDMIRSKLKSAGGSTEYKPLYCFMEYSDVPKISIMLESFDEGHCIIYDDLDDYTLIKDLYSIKYDAIMKINLYEIANDSTGIKAMEIVLTSWSSLRGSASMIHLACIKGDES